MSTPHWLVPGSRVAVLSGREESVTFAHVEKVGKRDVVLDNEQRFSLTRLRGDEITRRRGGSWDPDDVLVPRDSPRAKQAYAAQLRRRSVGAARAACDACDKALRTGDLPAAQAEYARLGEHLQRLASEDAL